jgi:hypothetical protein
LFYFKVGNLDLDFRSDKNNNSNFNLKTKTPSSTKPPIIDDIETLNMNKLVSMGFGDRKLNSELLKKYSHDMTKVVTHLLEKINDDWSSRRH